MTRFVANVDRMRQMLRIEPPIDPLHQLSSMLTHPARNATRRRVAARADGQSHMQRTLLVVSAARQTRAQARSGRARTTWSLAATLDADMLDYDDGRSTRPSAGWSHASSAWPWRQAWLAFRRRAPTRPS